MLVRVSETTVRTWVAEYDAYHSIKKSLRGKHSKVESPIHDPEFVFRFKDFVKNNSRKRGNILPCNLCGKSFKALSN